MSQTISYPHSVRCYFGCGGEYRYRANGREWGRTAVELEPSPALGCSCPMKPGVNESAYFEEIERLAIEDYEAPQEDDR